MMSRKDLTSTFIAFAVERNLVDTNMMREYDLTSDPVLQRLLKVSRFATKDVFSTLYAAGLIK